MKQPKPFFRAFTGTWYVQIGRRQVNLGRDKRRAFEKYLELMSAHRTTAEQVGSAAELFDRYLDWCATRRALATYRQSLCYLNSFAALIGTRMPVWRLKPFHITKWIDSHLEWSDTTRHNAISIVQRALNWGVRQGLLDRSPLTCLEDKPSRRRREVVYSLSEWNTILAAIPDDDFRLLVCFLRETGCRPQEARAIEARHVDLDRRVIVFAPSESKGQRTERVIILNDAALRICRSLCERHSDGVLFRNQRGAAWTKDAIKCRFKRLEAKAGIPRLCAYAIRHTFATEALKNGVDPVSLANLMGHADVSMIARTYQHLGKNLDYLRQQAIKATASSEQSEVAG